MKMSDMVLLFCYLFLSVNGTKVGCTILLSVHSKTRLLNRFMTQ